MIASGTGCHEPAEGPDYTDSFWTGIAATVLSLAIYGIGFPLLNTMELKVYDLYFRSG